MGGKSAPSNKQLKKQADYQYSLDQRAMQDQLQANRVNQQGPWGSVTWEQDPSGKWTQNTQLAPAEQQRLDQQRGLLTGLGDVAQGLTGQLGQAIQDPFSLDKFAAGPTGSPTGPQFGQLGQGPQFSGAAQGPQFSTDFGTIDPNAIAGAGQAQAGQASAAQAREYELQKQLDMSGLSDLPEASEAARQQVIDAMYGQAMSRLQPQFEQQRREQLDRLYAMGGREGDPMFEQQKANLERQLTDANQQALWNAIGQGGAEQSRLFGLGMANRQQTWQEALGQGQFTNQALMNQYQQGLGNAQMANQVGIANAGNATQAGIANAANAQRGLLAGLDFNRQGTLLGNQTAQQGWENAMRGTEFNNALAQQGWQNQLTGTQFNNATQQQQFQNQMAQNAEQSRIRNEQIQQALLERGVPFSEMGQVLGMMGNVQNPQFQQFAQGQISGPDYLGSWNQAQAQRAAAQQGMMSGLGTLAGVGGTILGGPIGGGIADTLFKRAATG